MHTQVADEYRFYLLRSQMPTEETPDWALAQACTAEDAQAMCSRRSNQAKWLVNTYTEVEELFVVEGSRLVNGIYHA